MLARLPGASMGHAVLLTASKAAGLSRPSCGAEHTFRATNPLPAAHYCFKSFSLNTYGSPRKCCKQKTYGLTKPFRCNTYKKHGGCGEGLQLSSEAVSPKLAPTIAFRPIPYSLPPIRSPLSLPHYLLTSLPLGAHRAPLATLFPPWLANTSASTSWKISNGAKRSHAPFAFRPTPSRHSRATSVVCESRFIRTINIAGSKLVRATVR